jgi:hypothetical protein
MYRLHFEGATAARAALLVAAMFTGASAAGEGPMFTGPQLRDDLAQLERALHEMPPDLARSADLPALNEALRALDARLATVPPLDRDSVWQMFATFNPLLADGHLFIGFVDWRGDARAHLAGGGRFFPFEMQVTADCAMTVRAELGGQPSALTGATLRAVNGRDAREVCEQMLARAHGDTRVFRADLVSRRFWFYYWKMFGAPAAFDIEIVGSEGVKQVPGSTQLPQLLAEEKDFARQFRLQIIAEQRAAILTLRSFAWPDTQQFLDFTHDAFAKIHAAHTRTLIIDLRDNGGGDDALWIEGVMPYIATRRYRTASRIRKRVVVADAVKHEAVGEVVDGEIDTWFPPQPDNPLRFTGKLYVAVGAGTFSSAVSFGNVIRDFGFGTLAGVGGSVRADQSGGARRTTLTHCGLIVVTPRFVLSRPSGAREPRLFTPDLDFDAARPLGDLVRANHSK